MSNVNISLADLAEPVQADAVRAMTNAYAQDPMGNGAPLPQAVLDALVPGLRAHPAAMVFLAWNGVEPVGIATCFLGFSTFAAQPLVNIHDLFVVSTMRGRGVGRQLLDAVAEHARSLNCCKLTLEVLENNHRGRAVYAAAGFTQAAYQEVAGGALFYAKPLHP